MTANYFLDSNILLYAFSSSPEDALKKEICKKLLLRDKVGISSQVMLEFISTALRRPALGIAESEIDVMVEYSLKLPVLPVSCDVIMRAIELRRQYQLSHWDSTIVSAAETLGCSTLYSEDLSHGQNFGRVQVINPFQSP